MTDLKTKLEQASELNDTLFQEVLDTLQPDMTHGIRAFWEAGAWENAALALVERMLPGWTWLIDATAPKAGVVASLLDPVDPDEWVGTGATPALALLIALLTALTTDGGRNG